MDDKISSSFQLESWFISFPSIDSFFEKNKEQGTYCFL